MPQSPVHGPLNKMHAFSSESSFLKPSVPQQSFLTTREFAEFFKSKQILEEFVKSLFPRQSRESISRSDSPHMWIVKSIDMLVRTVASYPGGWGGWGYSHI